MTPTFMFSQADQMPLVNDLCQRPLSPARTNTSRRFSAQEPQEEALGLEVTCPPRLSHCDQGLNEKLSAFLRAQSG